MDSDSTKPSVVGATRVRFLVLAWLSLAAMVIYWQRTVIAVPEKTIRQQLSLTEEEMGQAMAAFGLAYALCQIPAGWLGHRIGGRRAVPLGVGLSSLATAAMAGATGWWGLCAGRFAMGAAQAAVFPASVATFRRWFPADQRALPNGWLTAFMSVGTIAGTSLCGWLLLRAAWPTVMCWAAVPGVAWAVAFWWWFRDDPRDHTQVNASERARIAGVPPTEVAKAQVATKPAGTSQPVDTAVRDLTGAIPWRQLLLNGRMVCLSAQHFFRAAAYMFFQTWFPTFLQESRGVSLTDSGYLTGVPVLGVVVGSLAGGSISDRILTQTGSLRLARQGLAGAGLVGCAVAFVMAYFLDNALATVCVLGVGSLMFGVSSPVAYTLSIDLGGRHVASVFSVMNMAGNVGGLLTPLVVPWLVRHQGGWNSLPLWFAGAYALAAGCFVPLDPRRELTPARSPDATS